ncbi:MAG: metallophosphoesterase [Candidatus Nanoarchaeia archaeon]
MKFAHMADCHIGGWREPKLKELSVKAFDFAIDKCINEHVAFILICGDLFNTALPSIDLIRDAAAILKKAKDHDISVYIIPGSHDFSPSGKTMLDVLEKAGLIDNVFRFEGDKLFFTEDKTGVKITGLLGKKGGLEKSYYELLDKSLLESEPGFKIFMFHTALTEFKPAEMALIESQPVASLPKKFNYYAGGHVHYIFNKKLDDGLLTFPGALFPNNFKELEEFHHGGFYIVDNNLNFDYIPVKLKDVKTIFVDADGKTPEQVRSEILKHATGIDDKIVTIRVEGILSSGKPSDIDFKSVLDSFSSAYFVLRNTTKLTTKEFEELKVDTGNVEDVELKLIKQHIGKYPLIGMPCNEEEKLVVNLLHALNKEKEEGEKNFDFESRVVRDVLKVFALEGVWG